nr:MULTISPECIES: hypothetical protein [unclassified Streptomyces]
MGAVLTGCGGGARSGAAPGNAAADARTASVRAGKALRTAAARTSHALAGRYAAVAAAHPAASAGLAPLRAAVREHARAFAQDTPLPPAPTASPASPADAPAALKALAAEERRVADDRAKALTGAEPELARLLASVAAAGAVHAYLLTELAEELSS